MKLNRKQTTFGRHETFPLRYAWLTKGFNAVRERPGIFADPERAMVALGVGRNMVNAIQYWLQVTGVADLSGDECRTTALGEALLGPGGDCYLEDEATLWIIHWLIASNAEQATGFFWFFNRFAMPRFGEPQVMQGLADFIARDLQAVRSQSTLKSDVSTLLRMYTAALARSEDHLDSPLSQLELIEPEADPDRANGRAAGTVPTVSQGDRAPASAPRKPAPARRGAYRSPRRARPFLPPVALHFALAQRFAQERQPAIPIRVLLHGGDDWAAPGAVFRLSEEGLMATLLRTMELYPKEYELRDNAGLHQLYRTGPADTDVLDILRRHYRGAVA